MEARWQHLITSGRISPSREPGPAAPAIPPCSAAPTLPLARVGEGIRRLGAVLKRLLLPAAAMVPPPPPWQFQGVQSTLVGAANLGFLCSGCLTGAEELGCGVPGCPSSSRPQTLLLAAAGLCTPSPPLPPVSSDLGTPLGTMQQLGPSWAAPGPGRAAPLYKTGRSRGTFCDSLPGAGLLLAGPG